VLVLNTDFPKTPLAGRETLSPVLYMDRFRRDPHAGIPEVSGVFLEQVLPRGHENVERGLALVQKIQTAPAEGQQLKPPIAIQRAIRLN
jgi:hypothetical protein